MNIHEAVSLLESIHKAVMGLQAPDVRAYIDYYNRLMVSIARPKDYEELLAIGVGVMHEGDVVTFHMGVVFSSYMGKDSHVKTYTCLDAQDVVVILMHWITTQASWQSKNIVVKELAKLL